MSAPQVTVKSVDQHSDHARIHFEKEYSDYHYFWLRHNCDCKKGCRHPFTNERVIDSTDVSLKIQPSHISVEDGGKTVKFIWQNDSHESVFESSWLREHAYALNRVVVSPPPHEISNVEIDFKHYLEKYPNPDPNAQQIINGNSFSVPLSEEGFKLYRADCANKIKEYGCIVVRNRGLDTESIIHDFLPAGKEVISTHFGRIEDLKTDNTTNQNTDQLGYTDAAVNLHTDQPFIANPPGMQLLQCVNPAEKGGDNFIVDATRAALYLRLIDPISFDLLTRIPVKFHRKQKAFESIQNVPIVQLEEGSSSLADLSSIKIKQLRYSYFTYAPHNVPFEYMTQWYEAYNAFSNLVRDPKHQYKFLLNSGDCVLYDNHRMFHARTSFAGKRHVRGVYFNTSDVYAKLNIQH